MHEPLVADLVDAVPKRLPQTSRVLLWDEVDALVDQAVAVHGLVGHFFRYYEAVLAEEVVPVVGQQQARVNYEDEPTDAQDHSESDLKLKSVLAVIQNFEPFRYVPFKLNWLFGSTLGFFDHRCWLWHWGRVWLGGVGYVGL